MELKHCSCVRLISVILKRFFVPLLPQFQPVILIDPRNLRVHYRRRLEMFCGPFRTQRMSQSHYLVRAFLGFESMVNPGTASNQNAPSATLTPLDTGLGCLGLVLALSG